MLGVRKKSGPKPISLALQGGGSHGAFAWGVIDRLLEEEGLEIQAVTAASAGAMNAVAMTAGLIENGREGAKAKLADFWRKVNQAGGRNVFGNSSVWNAALSPDWIKNTPGWRLAETFALSLSPYDFNPFNLNPLHDALERVVDFEVLRERSPVALYISATEVRTSQAKIFREHELSVKHVMASACLPHLFHAVEIDGEPYWDGGYLANPGLWPLFYDKTPDDVLVVTLNPFVRKEAPRTPGDIVDRLNEITFNASLAAELRAIGMLQKLLEEGLLKDAAKGRYRRMLLHSIAADGHLDDLSLSTKFNTEWGFLTDLKERGRKAAEEWLGSCLGHVGERATLDIASVAA
ncbi:patatin-like phospholipase family protein [Caulobacter sp. 73W]|uniref:Patatin-like phospholipase family protein n=1 Tax=Caulobacter sp. 73W TaxID=3161137 RepID=A0AB39KPI3_9CAUL